MPEPIRALIVLIVLSGAVFMLARRPVCEFAMEDSDFIRRRNVWFAVTSIVFLSFSFWIFLPLAGLVLYFAGRKDPNLPALYMWVLFAVPPVAASLSGLGAFNQLLSLNYPRLLSITLLLPAVFVIRRRVGGSGRGWLASDLLIVGYVCVQLGLQLMVDSTTNTARYGVYAILDVALPYYVASRWPRDVKAFREIAVSLVIACMVLASVAVFENLKHWLLYSSLRSALGVQANLGNYLGRGGGALLRAQGSTGDPIVLGYVLSLGLIIHMYLSRVVAERFRWWLGLALVAGGLIAALSRGPWLGALVGLVVYRATGPKAIGGMLKFAAITTVIAVAVVISPMGATIIDYLPFVGTLEAENVTYRQQLLTISTGLILQNPWFGSYNYMHSPELQVLYQGSQGLIDIVNTYIGIGLASGLVGLTLFVGAFLAVGKGVLSAMWRLPDPEHEVRTLGQALLGCLACIMVIIFTVSSISVIPVVYWTVLGLGVGYAAMVRERADEFAPAGNMPKHAPVNPFPFRPGSRAS